MYLSPGFWVYNSSITLVPVDPTEDSVTAAVAKLAAGWSPLMFFIGFHYLCFPLACSFAILPTFVSINVLFACFIAVLERD